MQIKAMYYIALMQMNGTKWEKVKINKYKTRALSLTVHSNKKILIFVSKRLLRLI